MEKSKYRRTRGNGTGTAYRRGKTWTAAYTYSWEDGIQHRRTKGGFRTKKEALEYIPQLKRAKSRKADIMLRKLFDEWCPFYAPRISETTMKGMKSAFKYFAEIENMNIGDISIDDLQDCVDSCPRGKRTRENMKYLIVQLFKYAIARHIIRDNIAEYIYCGKEDGSTRPAFDHAQVEQIRRAAEQNDVRAIYTYCMIYLGFRPNEMLTLTKESYDKEHNCLVGGFKTEAGRNRPIPINPKIAPYIADLIDHACPWIFPNEDGDLLTDEEFREDMFYPLLQDLGIQPIPTKESPAYWKPYSCRHTFANLMKNVQGSDTDKAALMGHSDASMTKYYQSADYDSIRAIIESM